MNWPADYDLTYEAITATSYWAGALDGTAPTGAPVGTLPKGILVFLNHAPAADEQYVSAYSKTLADMITIKPGDFKQNE